MRFAILTAGTVSNFAEAEHAFADAQGWIAVGPSVSLGDVYDPKSGAFKPPTTVPADRRAAVIGGIDADVDALYAAVVGNRAEEYTEAERQAQAFADGGYAGAAPPMVASWATAKGWTGRQAADDILQQAAAWRGAQEQIRAQRLLRKEQARGAATVAELQTVSAQWSGFVAAVRQQLGA